MKVRRESRLKILDRAGRATFWTPVSEAFRTDDPSFRAEVHHVLGELQATGSIYVRWAGENPKRREILLGDVNAMLEACEAAGMFAVA